MIEFISPYIDTDKKLHIRFDKLLVLLNGGDFTGTIECITGSDNFRVLMSKGLVYTDKSFTLLANLPKKSLFRVSSAFRDEDRKGLRDYHFDDFLYFMVSGMAKSQVLSLLEPYAAEYFSIKPEAAKLVFIHDELEPFVGHKRIEIFSNLKKSCRIIYFLLLSRYATIVPSTDEEKAKITEKINNSTIFTEAPEKDEIPDISQKGKKEAPEKEASDEEKLSSFLNANEKYNDVFSLFGLDDKFDEKVLHREYVRIIQRIHPDRLHGISPLTADRAKAFLQVVSECYELIREQANRDEIRKLMQRYGPIRSRLDFMKMKEYDEAMGKANALAKIGSFESAARVFDFIYQSTQNPLALEKKNLALWHLAPRWSGEEKREKYAAVRDELLKVSMIHELSAEALYILVAIYEYFENIHDAIKVLDVILKYTPDDTRAVGMKKRILYYDRLRREEEAAAVAANSQKKK